MSSVSFWMSLTFALAMFMQIDYPFINGCPADERNYLLDFKGGLIDPTGRLSSWQGYNCCQWKGIRCDIYSGHVLSLDLKDRFAERYDDHTESLSGAIHPSLFNLQNLEHLDLGYNDFNGTSISPLFAKLQRLTFLSLARAGFGGEIPAELGNVTTLRYLDLSIHFYIPLESRRFAAWIRNLRSLEYLAMDDVDLSMASKDWGNALSSLSNLKKINLHFCQLSGTIPSLLNLSHLSHLDLSWNSFPYPLPDWFLNVSSLSSLDIHYCGLNGSIPSNFLHRSSLRYLDLASNYDLGGVIPHSITNFSMLQTLSLSDNNLTGDLLPFGSSVGGLFSLEHLDLGSNKFSGTIPYNISKLVQLETLILNSNNLTGSISLSPFDSLAYLKEVDFSENQLTVNISSSLILQFAQLEYLGLRFCNLQGEIPAFLSTQYSLEYLDLADNNIVGNIPTWLWDLPSLSMLNLSQNRLEGSLPPVISKYMVMVDLHNNSLHGSIPDFTPWFLDISENRFNGSIPSSICSASDERVFLDMSNNGLTGVIPTNLVKCSQLIVLNLARNFLEGGMPEGLGNLTRLETLNLSENKLQGNISPTANCTKLQVFDIGKNRIHGSIPVWIGELAELRILSLAFNKFQGSFPQELLRLRNLKILDLSHNILSGHIPQSLRKFKAMANQSQSEAGEIQISFVGLYGLDMDRMSSIKFTNQITVWVKGHATPYPKIISAFKFIDLSHNKFSGNIPEGMGDLKGLISLNISNNNLGGRIPKALGGMAQLESLDLSGNILSGKIPEELVSLTFLEVLNLSCNNLSGLIPQGKQFATFGASSYQGNPNLHGPPLENGKLRSGTAERGSQVQSNSTGVTGTDADADEMDRWWAVTVGLCFGVGFATVIAVLCFHLKGRYRCFALLDRFIEYLFER